MRAINEILEDMLHQYNWEHKIDEYGDFTFIIDGITNYFEIYRNVFNTVCFGTKKGKFTIDQMNLIIEFMEALQNENN